MGEALLMNHGGMRFRELVVLQNPEKLTYICGTGISDYIDLTGAKIAARLGVDLVSIDNSELTYSAAAVTAGTTAIVVSATIGHTTKSVSIPITTLTPDPVLNNNSWDIIATVAKWGKASEAWDVGDEKTVTIGGSDVVFRIIGFGHDDLHYSETDSIYVRKNEGHAGITFQAKETAGTAAMRSSNSDTALYADNWKTSTMRLSTLVTYYNALPTALKDVIKTITKQTVIGGYGSANASMIDETADQVFLLSLPEIADTSTYSVSNYVSAAEIAASSLYDWYDDNLPPTPGVWIWTRSPHDPTTCSEGNHYISISGNGNLNAANVTSLMNYYPAFCV